MIRFDDNYSDAGLISLGLVLEDLFILQELLSDAEFTRIDSIQDDGIRVKMVVEILNSRKALPPRYKALTANWTGYQGIHKA